MRTSELKGSLPVLLNETDDGQIVKSQKRMLLEPKHDRETFSVLWLEGFGEMI